MNTSSYTPTIGLEIHVELTTETKMFCSSRNEAEAPPNTHICPICMGHPGTLPTINKKAVESVIVVGLALGGKIAAYTEFDRKNYFYPDIPKGYQISQYAYPLVTGGSLIDIGITRIHLEEDTARSLHDRGDKSLVDYNRAGVPLMELVTEPQIHDAQTASQFAKELQLLLRTLGVSEAQMERGQMRVEANISVGRDGSLGTKVEVKNLNSFRSVELAIAYEIERQTEVLGDGQKVIQETRGWDERALQTFSQRKKESSHDYRYFPDPDLPKIDLSVSDEIMISRLSENVPELPSIKRKKYTDLGIPNKQIETIISIKEMSSFFDAASKDATPEKSQQMANYLTSDIQGLLLQDPTLSIKEAYPAHFSILIGLISKGSITSRVAKDLLREAVFEGKNPEELIKERGLGQLDSEAIQSYVDQVISEYAEVVAEYRSGKHASLQFLIGQVMRASKGAANPQEVGELIRKRIE